MADNTYDEKLAAARERGVVGEDAAPFEAGYMDGYLVGLERAAQIAQSDEFRGSDESGRYESRFGAIGVAVADAIRAYRDRLGR